MAPAAALNPIPADHQIDACNKIIALKVFAGEKLATIYFWRARGDLDRAIADATEAIRLAKAKVPANIMTPPGSVLISAYSQRALAYEAKGDLVRARQDYAVVLEGKASDAGSKANQTTAKVRLSLLTEAIAPSPRPRMAKEAAISRFRVRCFASPRNDTSIIFPKPRWRLPPQG